MTGAATWCGFKLAVVYLVWALPLIMVGVPMAVGGVMADSDGSVQMLGVTIMVGASCLMMVYGIFITLLTPGFHSLVCTR
ncbi:MAG: hypothetical protein IPM07_14265 [Anaerolineales bacterium]|nr:hypothetical protein [Anaerolineales bacterium]